MPSLISTLSKAERDQLFEDLFYVNTGELRSFCDKHSVPYKILIEAEDGNIKTSQDIDRKKIVIKRVTHYLKTGNILPATIFSKEIVRLCGLSEKINEKDRLYYGCYEKKNPKMVRLLQELTDGKFKNGAIARILCREFWTRGEAPTFKEFAKAWLIARDEYSLKQHPEAAYLTDLSKGKAGTDWKKVRTEKAKGVMKLLSKFEKPNGV